MIPCCLNHVSFIACCFDHSGGAAQLIMVRDDEKRSVLPTALKDSHAISFSQGSALFPLFQVFYNGNSDKAWYGILSRRCHAVWWHLIAFSSHTSCLVVDARRTVCVVPAVVAMTTGIIVYFVSDDAPKGNYRELKRRGCMPEISAAASFRAGAVNFNSWILFAQYACSLGLELTMYNAAALYFADRFGQTTEKAAAIASTFGWFNIFARGLGGYVSDRASAKLGMRGRLYAQTVFLALEGALVLVFANADSLAGSIVAMTAFCLCSQAASGSSFGIVPYINPANTGAVSGIVGAGGNVGAVCFGLGFRQLEYKQAFTLMGSLVMASSVLSAFVNIEGHGGIFCIPATPTKGKSTTLTVPDADPDVLAEKATK